MRLTDIMSGSGLAFYAEVALIVFFVVFLAVVGWIFLPSRKRELDRASRIPLEEGDPSQPSDRGAGR